MIRWWWRRGQVDESEAEKALEAARESHRRAEEDLAAQREALPRSQATRAALTAHNVSNHYDDLIARIAREAASRGA